MKATILITLAVIAYVAARPEEKYTDRYDNLNVGEILNNQRLLAPYIKCLLDQGRCTPDGKEMKSHVREALENNCAKCTEKQRSASRVVIGHLINKEKEAWGKLVAKYDPTHKYTTKYEEELTTIA